jgi:hypothetical protein
MNRFFLLPEASYEQRAMSRSHKTSNSNLILIKRSKEGLLTPDYELPTTD